MATEGSPVRELEKKFEHLCEVCGGRYLSSITYGKCCSDKCRTRRWRRTEKGRACLVRGNLRHKRPDVEKVCIHCKKDFVTARLSQELCRGCSPSQSRIRANARYRVKNIDKVRMWGRTSKKACREHYYSQTCSIDGCNKEGDRHHPDYDKPLEVVWLCKKHHRDEHMRLVKCE